MKKLDPTNEIQNPSANERLRAWAGIRTPIISPSISPEIQPVVLVEDLTKQGIGGLTRATRACMGRNLVTGNAGKVPVIALRNTKDSNVLVRLRKIIICNPGASAAPIGIQFQGIPTIGWVDGVNTSKCFLDGRMTGEPAAMVSVTPDGAIGPSVYDVMISRGPTTGIPGQIEFPFDVLIPPRFPGGAFGAGVAVRLDALAGTLEAGFFWTEEDLLV